MITREKPSTTFTAFLLWSTHVTITLKKSCGSRTQRQTSLASFLPCTKSSLHFHVADPLECTIRKLDQTLRNEFHLYELPKESNVEGYLFDLCVTDHSRTKYRWERRSHGYSSRQRDIEGKDGNAVDTMSTSSVSERNWRVSFGELKAPRIAHARFPGCDTEYATNRGV